jgi:nucleoside-diphosphate-sugar epimerase
MNTLVTGGSGRIGRYVVADLVRAGHKVMSADISPISFDTARTIRVDLTESGEVYRSFADSGAEAVIHLGAWANPGIVPDQRTYGENVQGTFNVFQACADLGIRRVVSASSAQVYGLASAPPLFLPLDEDHPCRPVNCYALSKMAGEQAAEYVVANYGMQILSFRFMGVRTPDQLSKEITELAKHPAQGGGLLWTRTDSRDAATACRLAIEAEEPASGVYNITGPRVVLNEPTADLVDRHFGKDVEIRKPLPGSESPMSCVKARDAFGYKPGYEWSETQGHTEEAA